MIVEAGTGTADPIRKYLADQRHSCLIVNGIAQLDFCLNAHNPEVAIVELNGPRALSVIPEIRKSCAALPIIALTNGDCDQMQMQAAVRAGATGYVSRNLPFEQLYCVLSRVLARNRFHKRRHASRREMLGAVA